MVSKLEKGLRIADIILRSPLWERFWDWAKPDPERRARRLARKKARKAKR
jgi:hypothetical protein